MRPARHRLAPQLVGKPREAETLVKSGCGLVDGIRHEETKGDRAGSCEQKGQPESFLKEIPTQTLTLHTLVDGEQRIFGKVHVNLDDATVQLLRQLGGENLSKGIRLITAGRLGENGEAYFEPFKPQSSREP